jgi:hypothetical protein
MCHMNTILFLLHLILFILRKKTIQKLYIKRSILKWKTYFQKFLLMDFWKLNHSKAIQKSI